MRYATLFATLALASASGQNTVKPTPGALGTVTASPAISNGGTPVSGSTGKIATGGTKHEVFQRLERDFDYSLKTADANTPLDLLGATRGLYVQGYGAVFTTEVDLAWNNLNPMFVRVITPEYTIDRHARKMKNLDVLKKQMQTMVTNMSKTLDLPPGDHLVLAVRLLYLSWEDRTGLPDQIMMTADRRGGEVKVDIQ